MFRGLSHWQHLLLSSLHEVTVLTDHKNLEYYKEPHHINQRIARYVQCMQDYNFIIKHIPGKNNKSDALSQHPDYKQGTNDNTNVTVLPPHLFIQTTTLSCLFSRATTLSSIDEWVQTYQLHQPNLLKKWATTYPLKQMGELYWYGDQLGVMEDTSLKRGVISLYHDSPMGGHPGISNTTWAIARDFWWPSMKKDVTKYIKGCTECQANKNQANKTQTSPIPDLIRYIFHPIHIHSHRLHCQTTHFWFLQYNTHYYWYLFQSFHFHSLQWNHKCWTNSQIIHYLCTSPLWTTPPCYVTVGTFTQCGLGSTKQRHRVVWFWVLSTKSEGDLDSFWWQVVNLRRNKSSDEE